MLEIAEASTREPSFSLGRARHSRLSDKIAGRTALTPRWALTLVSYHTSPSQQPFTLLPLPAGICEAAYTSGDTFAFLLNNFAPL